MKKRFLCFLMAFALLLAFPMSAFAAGSAFDDATASGSAESAAITDGFTGNSFFLDHTASNVSTDSDFYWIGSSLAASNLNVGLSGKGSLLAAGSDLSFANSKINDSLRVAGSILSFSNVEVGNNITVAGSQLSFNEGTSGNGLYAAGSEVDLAGSYNGVYVTAGTIAVDNVTCLGNMTLLGSTITVGPNVTVLGTLEVPEDATVTIAESSAIAEVVEVKDSTVQVEVNDDPQIDIVSMVFSVICHILLVAIIFWLMRERLEKMAEITSANWAKTILIGLATVLLLPPVLLVACIPLVTVPIVGLVVLGMMVVAACSIPFAGAALGRLFFKNMKPLASGILLTTILTVIASLPYMSLAVMFVCTVITVGYIMQALNDLRKRRSEERIRDVAAG